MSIPGPSSVGMLTKRRPQTTAVTVCQQGKPVTNPTIPYSGPFD